MIADLMLLTLTNKPDKSEYSVIGLFRETVKSEYVEGKDKDGNPIHGFRIIDFKLKTGEYLSKLIRWDFQNAVWNPDYQQGLDLLRLFEKKAVNAGYIVDGSDNYGLYLGVPYNLSQFYRLKSNLIASFDNEAETEYGNGTEECFYVRKRHEVSHYHNELRNGVYPRIKDYDKTRELQLWRIPAGRSTGIIWNEKGRVTCYVLKGRCSFEKSRWEYGIFDDDEEVSWKEQKEAKMLSANQASFAKSNDWREETTAPQTAYFKVTNTDKSDLLLYVVDAEKTEYVSYAPVIGISRLRMGTDGKGIRTLIAFHDCELDCRYCINPQCKMLTSGKKVKYKSAEQIADTIKKDELYHLSTNGGITLGGGEPLLHCDFLVNNFFKRYGKKWHVTVETSLHVTPWMLFDMAPYIDEYVVDIKDMNPEIYKRYTGKDNEVVISNIQWLI